MAASQKCQWQPALLAFCFPKDAILGVRLTALRSPPASSWKYFGEPLNEIGRFKELHCWMAIRLRSIPLTEGPTKLVGPIPEEAKNKLRLAVGLLRTAREIIPIEKIIGGAIFFGMDTCTQIVMIPTRKAATSYKRAIRNMQELADQYSDHPRVLRAINRILEKGCLKMEGFTEEDPEFRLNGSGFRLREDVRNKMIRLLEEHLAAL